MAKIHSNIITEISQEDPVTESDRELLIEFKNGNPTSGCKIFRKHYKMVLKVVIQCTRGKWYSDDCLQAGAVGLYEAAKRFDPSLGFTFLTYATPWIRKYVMLEVCNETLPAGGVGFSNSIKDKLYRFLGYQLTGMSAQEIITRMKLSEAEYERLKMSGYLFNDTISLDEGREGEEGEERALDPADPLNVEEDIIDQESYNHTLSRILEEMAKLSPLHVRLLRNELQLDGERVTAHVIAREFKITVKTVATERREAFRLLRSQLGDLEGRGNYDE